MIPLPAKDKTRWPFFHEGQGPLLPLVSLHGEFNELSFHFMGLFVALTHGVILAFEFMVEALKPLALALKVMAPKWSQKKES